MSAKGVLIMKTRLDRIRQDIDELAKISVTQGPGCCRQTYTKEFAEARDYIVNAMSEVSGLILGQGGKNSNIVPTASTDGKTITFESSLPLQKFIIFEQKIY